MATAIVRKPISFRLREDVIARLKQRAALANYSLNNYVESVLLDDVYDEPNEHKNPRKTYTSVDEMINDILNEEE